MDYINPKELVQDAILVARKKASLSVTDMLIRGALSGVFLGFATSLAVIVTSQGLPAIVGAILFPVGFVMLVLLGLELATGNFALLPTRVSCRRGVAWAASEKLGLSVLRKSAGQSVLRAALLLDRDQLRSHR
jgi:formate/nitrite transporter FocA (FNT family)